MMKKEGVAKQLAEWTVVENGAQRFDSEYKKLAPLPASERSQLLKALAEDYMDTLQPGRVEGAGLSHFAIKDVARRIDTGTGSLVVARYYALVEGETNSNDDDVILDIKEQQRPAAYACMSTAGRRAWRRHFGHAGERHAIAFHALADHADEYLGWITLGDKQFSVRQRSPYKKDFPTDDVDGFKEYLRLSRQCGRILAREHIRGAHALRPDDPGEFCRAVGARCDNAREAFKSAVADLAFGYAARVEGDRAVSVANRVESE